MNDLTKIRLVVQVEQFGEQMLRARLMAPWQTQIVGRSWSEIEPRLIKKAATELSNASPRKWLSSEHHSIDPTQWQLKIAFGPATRSTAWQQPVELVLDAFRWDLQDGMTMVKIPAIRCDVYARTDMVNDDLIDEQARVALLRYGEKLDLWTTQQKFFRRSFLFKTIEVEVDLGSRSRQLPADPARAFRKKTQTLRRAASDLSRAELDPVYGRDGQAAEVADFLIGSMPQSVLLVGPAGVGKTSIVHRMISLSEKLGLQDRKIWSTTGSRLVSGMSGLGMWQERCIKLIREAHATRSILHVGSLIELMEAGKIEGQPGVASLIRQAVARGRLVIIGECTPEQIGVIERDEPLLLRALVRYDVSEPDSATLTGILRQAANDRVARTSKKSAERSHFSDEALEELHRLHRRYATYSALPAQPLRLMQTILEHVPAGTHIQASDVSRAFASQTGLPGFLVDDSQAVDLEAIRHQLASHVIGQTEPVDLVVNLIATLKTRMARPGRPLASLLFIGPTGVGKTEMAKALAELLYSDPRRMIRIDMSEYASAWSAVRLIGRPDEGDGTLTSPIREQPFSVVLLDEFEKADPAVFDLLLQLLGEGRLTDSLGRLADFRNAVVIMTSNLGVESFREGGFGFSEGASSNWRSHFEREVQRFIRPELLGRIDRIVPFTPLSRSMVREIADRELSQIRQRPGIKYADIQLQMDGSVADYVSQVGYQPKYGARPLRRAIERLVTVPLANELCELDSNASWAVRILAEDKSVDVRTERLDEGKSQRRKTSETAIDEWQKLARLARLAMVSTPLRDLENETLRVVRINDTLFEKLKSTPPGRRATALKTEIQQHAVTIERNNRTRETLLQASQRVLEKHMQIMLAWHRNEVLPAERLFDLPKRLLSELKIAVSALVEGSKTSIEHATLLIVGKPIHRAAVLWQAYEKVALENQWQIHYYTLKNYDPNLDRESLEYRKRPGWKSQDSFEEAESELAMRLTGPSSAEPAKPTKSSDVYRSSNTAGWDQLDASVGAVALQFSGFGVQAWLANEEGVMHFVDGNSPGQKKRLRYRVQLASSRLVNVNLAPNWHELPNLPERNPRRVFSSGDGVITDSLSGSSVNCPTSKWTDCLVDLVRQDREQQLWSSIGFQRMEPAATLTQTDSEEPVTT